MYLSAVRSRFACVLVSAAAIAACGGKGSTAGSSTGPAPSSPSGAPALPGGDTYAAQKTGPIAPNCAEAFCAEVEFGSKLACRDNISELDFTLATRISGKTDQLSCAGVQNASGSLDLHVAVRPALTASEEEAAGNEVGFKLRNYTGPGTYPLENLPDDGDYMGLKLTGKSAGHHEKVITVGTVACIPKVCEAIVADGSQPVPTDEMSTHEFRVRVEIRCPRGGQVGNMHCEGGTMCSFAETPTLLADLVCRQ